MLKIFAPLSLLSLAAAMTFSVFSCCLLGLYLATGVGLHLPFKELIAAACTIAVLAFVMKTLPTVGTQLGKFADARHALWYAILLGLALRLMIWIVTLPEVQINDGWHYLELAKRLYLHQPYELDGYAFWPPGTPLVYAAFMHLLGQPAWIAVVVNCSFFLLSAISVRAICQSLGFAPRDAALAVAVMACWPELFFPVSQVSKEILLIGMLPAVLALLLSQRTWPALLAGGVAGLAIMTQPSLTLLPLFLAAALLAARITPRTVLARMALLCIGAMLAIAPWTYRNYQVFGEFVPISTNAGLVLHAGNQPAMVNAMGEVGGFLTPPAPPVPLKNDLLLSRWHKAEAIRFILDNKADFVRLVWQRMVITMGDDSDSAYRSLRLTDKVSDKVYLLSKALSNACWMAIAAALAVSCWLVRKRHAGQELAPVVVLAASATLYLIAVHGMAEGGGRHHMAWSWIYALILVAALGRVPRHKTAAARETVPA